MSLLKSGPVNEDNILLSPVFGAQMKGVSLSPGLAGKRRGI